MAHTRRSAGTCRPRLNSYLLRHLPLAHLASSSIRGRLNQGFALAATPIFSTKSVGNGCWSFVDKETPLTLHESFSMPGSTHAFSKEAFPVHTTETTPQTCRSRSSVPVGLSLDRFRHSWNGPVTARIIGRKRRLQSQRQQSLARWPRFRVSLCRPPTAAMAMVRSPSCCARR